MWGGAQWHVIMCKVEGVELIRCVNGCVTSLGTGPAMQCSKLVRMRNRGEIVFASYFQFKRWFLASKRVSKHGFTF